MFYEFEELFKTNFFANNNSNFQKDYSINNFDLWLNLFFQEKNLDLDINEYNLIGFDVDVKINDNKTVLVKFNELIDTSKIFLQKNCESFYEKFEEVQKELFNEKEKFLNQQEKELFNKEEELFNE